MAESLGRAVLDLATDDTDLVRGLAAARAKSVKEMAAAAKQSKAAMVGILAGAGVAIGVGLYKVADQFDAAFDTIRSGTGASGKALDGLKDDFRKVVKDVPASFSDAGKAIAELNTRLGLTGKPLQARAKQFLELSRITGEDVTTSIRSVSKAFVDWEVPTRRQGKTLDGFFRLSQQTGIGVSELAQSVQEFGSPLRQLGFSLDESAAMFATFEKAGVNTSTMVPGLKFAISNLTRPTSTLKDEMKELGVTAKTPGEALRQVMKIMTDESIPAVKRTGLAMDVFGRRAGSDMAEAIKQGRFSVDDLVKVMRGGGDTIMGVGEDTQDFTEKLQILKNRGMLALEGPAMAVFDGLTKVANIVLWATDAVGKVPGPVKTLVGALAGAGGLFFALMKARTAIMAMNVALAANPYVALAAAIGAFAYVVVTHWEQIKEAAAATWQWIKDHYVLLATLIAGPVGFGVAEIVKHFNDIVDAAKATWQAVVDSVTGFAQSLIDAGRWIVETVVSGITAAADLVAGAVKWYVTTLIDGIKAYLGMWVQAGTWVVNRVVDGFKTVTDALSSAGGWLKDRIVGVIKAAADGFLSVGTWIVNQVVTGFKTFTDALSGVGGWLSNQVTQVIHGAVGGFTDVGTWAVNQVVNGFKTVTDAVSGVGDWLVRKITGIVKDVADGFRSVGGTIIGWIVDGLKGGANQLVDFLNSIIDVINKLPGVSIGHIDHFKTGGVMGDQTSALQAGAAPAGQGLLAQGLYNGGKVLRPLAIVGEEAPRHPEYVIPTNPAYRGRALGLFGSLASELGVPGFKIGGILGGALDAISGLGKGALDVLTAGPEALIGLLPNPADMLPDWLQGTGKWIIGRMSSFIKDKIGGLLSGVLGIGGGGGGGGGSAPAPSGGVAGKVLAMVAAADAINSRGYPYVYGGGHNPSFSGPYDCSGAVSAVLHAAGLLGSPITTDGLKVFGEAGDGQYVTIGVRGSTGRNAHTMIRIGNRYFESGSGHGAQWVGGWSGDFPIHRHPPGLAQGGVIGPLAKLFDPSIVGWGLRKGGVIGGMPFLGAYESGGVLPGDGFYMGHEGETVTPKGRKPGVTLEMHGDVHVHDRFDTDVLMSQLGWKLQTGA